jgi:hypothetical protein
MRRQIAFNSPEVGECRMNNLEGNAMGDNSAAIATDGKPITALADEITRLSDTIRACERLCLLSARTVVRAALPLHGTDGPLSFIPGITRDLQSPGNAYDHWHDRLPLFLESLRAAGSGATARGAVAWYPTTSAGCIVALQALVPVIGRFRVGIRENKDLAFHPIQRETLDAFDPRKRLPDEITGTIEAGISAFNQAALNNIYGNFSDWDLTDGDLVDSCLFSTTFGGMHPYTAAQTLRALAGSSELFRPVWRQALFIVLWFLNRRGSSLRGQPNIQATSSPGTAVMTSKCVDAVEDVYAVFERRWNRFQTLIRLIQQLADVLKIQVDLKNEVELNDFVVGYQYKQSVLTKAIRATLADIAKDTGIVGLYATWHKELNDRLKKRTGKADFLRLLVNSFVKAVESTHHDRGDDELVRLRKQAQDEIACIQQRIDKPTSDPSPYPWPPPTIPPWVCSRNFWKATATAMQKSSAVSEDYADAVGRSRETLKTHWHRHFDALQATCETTKEVEDYFGRIMQDFQTIKSGMSVEVFIEKLTAGGKHIARLHLQLRRGIEAGVKWAEILMNRHLGYANSGLVTLFDPNELAHAVHVVTRVGGRARFETIIASLRAVCAAQREDGTWPCQQPFYWTDAGQGFPTLSVETALAVVWSVNEIVRNPEGFGASREEISTGLRPVYDALDRFFRWMSGSIQSVPVPPALINPDAKAPRRRDPPLYGWSSDRVFEPGTINSWVTASTIEFLINYRQLLQEVINQRLRSAFLSHHPAELLPPLSEVAPTDLRKFPTKEPVTTARLLEVLQPHKALELAEGPWLPTNPERPAISFYSALLYGPPGSSKTFMAKAIAGELRWPLISLSPADFLARGEQHVEAQSEAIFTALAGGSRLVYFFDEIDELIRDRDQITGHERSVFTFLTPSFLTKLQDLHDAAKQQEFIFILGTNYRDHIDSAAKRSGRIDEQLAIVYSDQEARTYVTIDRLLNKVGLANIKKALAEPTFKKYAGNGTKNIISLSSEFGGFLSYSNFQAIVDELVDLFKSSEVDRIDDFIQSLMEVNERAPRARFKPEVRLADYCDRPEALDEVEMIIESIPHRPFPGSANKKSLRLKELTELRDGIRELKKFRGDVEKLRKAAASHA